MRHDSLRFAIGGIEARLLRQDPIERLQDAEFRVFSQWGHDGIIQFLIRHVSIAEEIFVELGVESYREANTRFLMMHDNWQGLIIDAGRDHQAFLEESGLGWQHSIDARTAFITKENINSILSDVRIPSDIGLLSIDIDGNDYWIYDAISVVCPRILILEYNGVFGSNQRVSIPYQADFDRMTAHPSGLYFGASLPAMISLAEHKGYRFVGTNSAGGDAFFVRKDLAELLPPLALPELTAPRFRQARDASGELTYTSGMPEQRALLRGLQVVDVDTGSLIEVTDLE